VAGSPQTAKEFEARFAIEEDCRAYWIEARWGGKRRPDRRACHRAARRAQAAGHAVADRRHAALPMAQISATSLS
jgi:hypothetical protein